MVKDVMLISVLVYHGAKILLVKKMTQRTVDAFINNILQQTPWNKSYQQQNLRLSYWWYKEFR